MDQAEWEVYRKDREERIEALTSQLKDAGRRYEDLFNLVAKAIPTMREIANRFPGITRAGSVTEEAPMDEATLQAEREAHRQNLIQELELRTRQLQQAVGQSEQLYILLRNAAPAFKDVDDPAVRQLLAKIGK